MQNTRKIIIAGGRDFDDYMLLENRLDFYLMKLIANGDKIEIVSGTANGADKLGERYAKERGYNIAYFPANWDKFGKRAGYLRNAEMANYADACVCFWDGVSKGTKHMIDLAKEKKLITKIVNY